MNASGRTSGFPRARAAATGLSPTGVAGFLAAALCLPCLPASGHAAAEVYSDWAHAGDVHVNTSAQGAAVSGTLTSFPLLVRLDGTNFDFSQARGDGRDVRFASASGRHLPYQVERWDSAGAKADIWVLADTVRGNDGDQAFTMHWGRPAAPDSSRPGAVFDPANGFLGVFHLGGSPGSRANAVPGYQAAATVAYDGDESGPGVAGLCDNLVGGDYLQLRDGYSELSQGFTFSVWANPSAALHYARLLDMGNGEWNNNIVVSRGGTSDELYLDVFNGSSATTAAAGAGSILLNQWQHFAVTVSRTAARVYRNGVLLKSQTLAHPIPAVHRANAYLGKSNWAADAVYNGKLDEARISKTARSADWIRLSWANQRPGSGVVTFQRRVGCVSSFRAPRDTTLPEGRAVTLSSRADCAVSVSWASVSGPTPRIFDPSSLVLEVPLPRVSGDTTLVYRFVARYGDSVRSKDVRVHVKEAIPDPAFALPALPPWDGRDSLVVKPVITNLSAVRATRDSVIAWEWTLQGVDVDTTLRRDALVLRRPGALGPLNLRLCLDNGGGPVCLDSQVNVIPPSASLRPSAPAPAPPTPRAPRRDARGRLRADPGAARSPDFPESGALPARP